MNEDKPNYYAIIPADIRYDSELKDKAKLLYGEITCLCNEYGFCYATNKYFADLYKVSLRTISELINSLVSKGYLISEIIYKEDSKEVKLRKLYLSNKTSIPIEENFYTPRKKLLYPIEENFQENNTSNNIKENIYKRKNFNKPTIEEINNYCIERNNGIDAEYFYDFYESKDWMIGKNKMKDWKSCIRTWERKNKSSSNKSSTKRYL